MSKQLRSDLVLVFVTLIWGTTFIIVKNAVKLLPVYNFLFLRFFIAFLVLALFYFKKLKAIDKRTLVISSAVGIMLFAGYALQTTGLKYTTAAKSGFITGFSVVLVPVLEAVLIKAKPSKSSVIGIIFAVIGLGLLTTNVNFSINFGDLLTLLCAAAFAMQVVLIAKYASSIDTYLFATIQIAVVAALSGIFSILFENPTIPLSLDIWPAILITGILATAFALSAQNAMQANTSATHAALIFSLEPVFSAIAAFLIAGEVMSFRAVIGAILMFAGIILSEIPDKDKFMTDK